MKEYITLDEALGPKGEALIERNLKAEYETGKIGRLVDYLHLLQEQRLVNEWREAQARLAAIQRSQA